MSDLRGEVAHVIGKLGFSTWGIGDISGLHPLGDEFSKALSVALAYALRLGVEYAEPFSG